MIPHKCPICNGHKIVPGGFYEATGESWSSSHISEPCQQCSGTGIIWEKAETPSHGLTPIHDCVLTTSGHCTKCGLRPEGQ